MPGPTSKLALAAGFIVVLALALVLVLLTRPGTQAAVSPSGPAAAPSRASAPAADVAAPAATPSAARNSPATPPRTQLAATGIRPELAPPSVNFSHDFKRDADGKLVPIITVKELREQFQRTDAAMNACLAQSAQHPTGSAMLSFSVVARDNKLVVETTGVHDEGSLAAYPELLECMHRTAGVLVLDGHAIPELGTPIYVRRNVRLDNGVLAENAIFNFSYIP